MYPEDGVKKRLLVGSDKKELKFKNIDFSKSKSKYIELKLPLKTKSITIQYNGRKNKIKLIPNYEFIYIEPRGTDFLEIVFSNKKPVFID